jgi:hypothetical protein
MPHRLIRVQPLASHIENVSPSKGSSIVPVNVPSRLLAMTSPNTATTVMTTQNHNGERMLERGAKSG